MAARMAKKLYESELMVLQAKLVDMQAWVQQSGARIVVIFEGRDAAGKGSTIKRVSEYLNPRVTRVVALGGIGRDLVQGLADHHALPAGWAGPATGYITVYTVEVLLLLATMAAMAPLIRRTRGHGLAAGAASGD